MEFRKSSLGYWLCLFMFVAHIYSLFRLAYQITHPSTIDEFAQIFISVFQVVGFGIYALLLKMPLEDDKIRIGCAIYVAISCMINTTALIFTYKDMPFYEWFDVNLPTINLLIFLSLIFPDHRYLKLHVPWVRKGEDGGGNGDGDEENGINDQRNGERQSLKTDTAEV